jgi:hypothetical protein
VDPLGFESRVEMNEPYHTAMADIVYQTIVKQISWLGRQGEPDRLSSEQTQPANARQESGRTSSPWMASTTQPSLNLVAANAQQGRSRLSCLRGIRTSLYSRSLA